MKTMSLKPLFKYPGGKGSELKHLKDFFPTFDTYIEPFLGGGAVFWATHAKRFIVNDCSAELIAVYRYSQQQEQTFIDYLQEIADVWTKKNDYGDAIKQLLSFNDKITIYQPQTLKTIIESTFDKVSHLPYDETQLNHILIETIHRKKKSLIKIQQRTDVENWHENALGVLGAWLYTYFRSLYNQTSFATSPPLKTALYLFLREYAYSSMFRFNADGGFNVPFGGNSYASKDFLSRLKQITQADVVRKLQQTQILQGDFTQAFIDETSAFMFLDPPYDSNFSTYNQQVFDSQEQIRLRDELKKLTKTKWLLVVKSTEFIENLYEQQGWYKARFDKSYAVNFKNRNDKDVEHLIITNYALNQTNN